jgi:hypothetical protein
MYQRIVPAASLLVGLTALPACSDAQAAQDAENPHYDRHLWIFRENPDGVFTQFNPNVTCAHAANTAHAAH